MRPVGRALTSRERTRIVLLAVLALALLTSACGVTRGGDDADSRRIRMMIPNSPGGGYDLTGRTAAHVMEEQDITGRFEITNVIGASGTVAMQRILNESGSEDLIMSMGLGVVGATYTFDSEARVSDATPIARLIEEQEAIVVPADSPYKDLDDFLKAWKADPKGIPVGGGSAPGGPDHLFPMQLAKAIGIDPTEVNYISYDGGGPLTSALLGEKIAVGTTGLSEFEGQIEDGTLRVLAVSGKERLDGVDAPTVKESGIDLVFTNWRGILAPPGLSDDERAELTSLVEEMHGTKAWKDALESNGWIDAFATGEEFEKFLRAQDKRVETTLKELGLA